MLSNYFSPSVGIFVGAIISCLLCLSVPNTAKADNLIFFESFPRGLYNFDTDSGAVTLRAPISGESLIAGMDVRQSDGMVFGVDLNSGNLLTINIDTGTQKVIGNTGINNPVGIAFDPVTDELFILSNGGELYATNPETAASDFIGIAEISSDDRCFGFRRVTRGLSISSDRTLYAFDVRFGLFELKRSTAAATFIGRSSCFGGVSEDSAFTKNGELYLANFTGRIHRIDITNGARTLIGQTGLGSGLWGLIAEPERIRVSIDVRPGSGRNSINPRSYGRISVAILSTDTFDATRTDPSTVMFGPDGASESHSRIHVEDVDGDGDADVVLHFDTQKTGIACGDTEGILTGGTLDSQLFIGSDVITTVGCR